METVTDEQFRLLCLLHLTEQSMQELLSEFVRDKTLKNKKGIITTDATDENIALSQILKFIRKPILEELKNYFQRSAKKIFSEIFTPTQNSYTVNESIDIKSLDISSLNYFLTMNLDILPTRKAKFRKQDGLLSCLQPNHQKKCCLQCQHNNLTQCTNCNMAHYKCYTHHTPCCLLCNTCDNCATNHHIPCDNRRLRNAFNFLHNVRNLNAHSNVKVYDDLKANSFGHVDFPMCTGWDSLWRESSGHVLCLFAYLRTHNVIDELTYITKCSEVTHRLPNESRTKLSVLYSKVLFGLCDDFKKRESNLTETVINLTETVNDLTKMNNDLSEKVGRVYKNFEIGFLLQEDISNCCLKLVNNFLAFQATIPKEELKLKSALSNALEKYVQTFLIQFLGDNGSLMVYLKNIKYDIIKEGYVYKFVITSKEGNGIPNCYRSQIRKQSTEFWKELERCIVTAVYIETKGVKPKVELHHVNVGSIVFTVSVSEVTDGVGNAIDIVHVIENCARDFHWNDMRISQSEKMDNNVYRRVSCLFVLYVIGTCESFEPYLEAAIKFLRHEILGPSDITINEMLIECSAAPLKHSLPGLKEDITHFSYSQTDVELYVASKGIIEDQDESLDQKPRTFDIHECSNESGTSAELNSMENVGKFNIAESLERFKTASKQYYLNETNIDCTDGELRKVLHSEVCQSDQDNDGHQCNIIGERDLTFISQQIGENWKDIAHSLGMGECHIEQIDADYRHTDIAKRAYQGLLESIRQSSKSPAKCWLIEILSEIGKHEIIEEYLLTFEIQTTSLDDDTPQIKEIVINAKEEEIERIHNFCEDSWTKNRLCIVTGLPGNRNIEIITAAISVLSKDKVIIPKFHTSWVDRQITFEEFMHIIRQSWKAKVNPKLSPEEDLWDALRKERKTRILLLDMRGVSLENKSQEMVWSFIRNVVQFGSTLKIILASYKVRCHLMHKNNQELIKIHNLTEEQSIKFLQSTNRKISRRHCKALHECTGGNLYLLRYIDDKIKTYESFNDGLYDLMFGIRENILQLDFIQRLIEDTNWSMKMTSVLDDMSDSEHILLAKLISFTALIPISSLSAIYKDQTTAPECDEMYGNHLILEKDDDGKNYRISTLTRCLVSTYIGKNDRPHATLDGKDHTLASVHANSNTLVRRFFLDLLVYLSTIFHSKSLRSSYGNCSCIINDYRVWGEDTKQSCNCIVARCIFQKYDISILKDIMYQQYNFFIPNILLQAPAEILLFLRHEVPYSELKTLERHDYCMTGISNKRHLALSLVVYALLKKDTGAEDRSKTLKTLDNCIAVLGKSVNVSPGYSEIALLSYLTRAKMKTDMYRERADVEVDLAKATNIWKSNDIGEIAKLEYHKTYTEIAFEYQEYDLAQEHGKLLLDTAVKLLSNYHPYTCKTFILLGNINKARAQFAIGDNADDASLVHSYFEMAKEIEASLTEQAKRFHDIEKYNIIEDDVRKFNVQTTLHYSILQTKEIKFSTRENAIEILKQFCEDSWTKNKLCIVCSLPGNGLRGVIKAATSLSRKDEVLIPNFISTLTDGQITIAKFLKVIREIWKTKVNPKVSPGEDTWSMLRKENKQRILVLDISGLSLDAQCEKMVWFFIRNVVQRGLSNCNLKIIVSSYELRSHIIYEDTQELIRIGGLSEEQSINPITVG